jgi:hypothetical protein
VKQENTLATLHGPTPQRKESKRKKPQASQTFDVFCFARVSRLWHKIKWNSGSPNSSVGLRDSFQLGSMAIHEVYHTYMSQHLLLHQYFVA